MSTAAAVSTESGAAGEGEAPASRKKSKLVMLAIPVIVLLVGAGLWFTGILPGLLGGHKQAAAEAGSPAADAPPLKAADPIFVEVPEIVANLNGNPRRPSYIKVKPRIEVATREDVARAQAAMPRLLDMFQTYLRELRPEELRGSAGSYRLKEELIARANLAAAPARVLDVLFTEMLVQ